MLHRRSQPPPMERRDDNGTTHDVMMSPIGSNVIAPDDGYYAWQIATIVARLHEVRRTRRARYRIAAS